MNRKFLLGATIAVLAILHFTFSRYIAIEIEKDSNETEAVNYQPVQLPLTNTELKAPEIAKDSAPSEPEAVKATEPVAPPIRMKTEIQAKREAEKELPLKKKTEPRETRAERLRRAEKILTGV